MCLNKFLGCTLNTNTWLNTCMHTSPKPPTCTWRRILQMWPFTFLSSEFSFLKRGVGTRTPPSIKKKWCSTSKIHIQRKFSYKPLHIQDQYMTYTWVYMCMHTHPYLHTCTCKRIIQIWQCIFTIDWNSHFQARRKMRFSLAIEKNRCGIPKTYILNSWCLNKPLDCRPIDRSVARNLTFIWTA